MPYIKKQKIFFIATGLIVIAGINVAIAINMFVNWHSMLVIQKNGSTVWDQQHGIGISMPSGKAGTTFSLSSGSAQSSAPADSLMDTLNGPVNISPNHPIESNQAQVLFKVPSYVPTNVDCTKQDPKRPRSICNAGIEVYNTTLGGWVPLETHIQNGNTLVANAPHFSEYRSVWTKIGDYSINALSALKMHSDNGTTPDTILYKSLVTLTSQFYNNLLGRFDPSKMEACEKSGDQDYTIDFQQTNSDIQPCVVKDGNTIKAVIGDHLALPIAVTSSVSQGITPDEGNESEVTTAVRNKVAQQIENAMKGGATTIVSGLDTNSFTIDENQLNDSNGEPISTIPMITNVSWPAVGGDYIITALSLFFKEERVAAYVDRIVDAADCIATGFQKIPGMAAGDVPGQLAESLKGCAVPAGLDAGLLSKIGVPELAGTFIKSTKILAESFQLGEDISTYFRTGHGIGDSAFTITNANRALLGPWINNCPGADNTLNVPAQGDGAWIQKGLGPDNSVIDEYHTSFKIVNEEGHVKMHIEKTTMPGLHNDELIPLSIQPVDSTGYGPFLFINQNYPFFRIDYNGPVFCD